MSRAAARRRPARVYAIADAGRLGADRLPDAVAAMIEAGIETIQLRAKRLADDALAELCETLTVRLSGWSGQLWIDDRVDVALAYDFAGVHLGQRDLPATVARKLLRHEQAIGGSTHDATELAQGEDDPAIDWLAIGPIFPTSSKERPDSVVGLAALARGRAVTKKPLVAIGGIDGSNIRQVLDHGADSAAVLSAVCGHDVAASCRRIVRAAGAAA